MENQLERKLKLRGQIVVGNITLNTMKPVKYRPLITYLQDCGIGTQYILPRTQQHNPVIER